MLSDDHHDQTGVTRSPPARAAADLFDGWTAPTLEQPLLGKRVGVWIFKLESPHQSESAARAILCAEEIARCERVIDPCRRRRLLIARAALRVILAGELGREPSSVRIVRSRGGRPVLPGRSVPSFSFSHSEGWAAVAVSSLARVGVDIEQTRRRVSGALIDRLLTRREVDSLPGRSPTARGEAFLLHWTAKEACAKMLGGGLASNLHRLELRDGASGKPRLLDPDLSDMEISRPEVGTELVGALAGTKSRYRELRGVRLWVA